MKYVLNSRLIRINGVGSRYDVSFGDIISDVDCGGSLHHAGS